MCVVACAVLEIEAFDKTKPPLNVAVLLAVIVAKPLVPDEVTFPVRLAVTVPNCTLSDVAKL